MRPWRETAAAALERALFGRRPLALAVFGLLTLGMAASASRLRIDAGFKKLLPLEHEYMRTFLKYHDEFGGANRVLVALVRKEGDIFRPEFFRLLKAVTDDVFFLPGVDRSRVRSLFTPNVRFVEIVEGGFTGGDVVPADFDYSAASLERVRANVLKSGQVGRLVANDFTGAIVSAELLEVDPQTGRKLDYVEVARRLEQEIRAKHGSEQIEVHIGVHIIGFAKVVGDITEGARSVVFYSAITLGVTALLVYAYCLSALLTAMALACSLTAVVWQLGLLPLLGFGIDPMSMLVPFVVFAIAVSHAVQMINSVRGELFEGKSSLEAARASFRGLLVPGSVALVTDTVGFLTFLLIKVEIIREMAVTASLGVAVIILTNLFLLPVLVSYARLPSGYRRRIGAHMQRTAPLWRRLAGIERPRAAAAVVAAGAALYAFGFWRASKVQIGDLQQGVPELYEGSRYNRDAELIASKFSIGVDILTVIAEAAPEACIDHEAMDAVDRFAWRLENVPGVRSVASLAQAAKVMNAGWNEGNPKWRVLPRDPRVLAQSVSRVETASGLLNADCTAMPVMVFTEDHKAETIARVVAEVKAFSAEEPSPKVRFRLATGNVGVMAATNEEVAAAQFPMLIYVYAASLLLCWWHLRSVRATVCLVAPLLLVSVLCYALMSYLDIGLKVNTLPMVALGAGIGEDYGIYIIEMLLAYHRKGVPLQEAYRRTLDHTGNAVFFTGLTMAIGVAPWMLSDLKFQADMGILLTFMFVVNMLAALVLLPAFARVLGLGAPGPGPATGPEARRA